MGVLVLLGLEALLAGVIYAAVRGREDRAVLYLVAVTAPLEVYRTEVGGVNLSLFRLSIALGLLWMVARSRGGVRWLSTPLALCYVLVATAVGCSLAFGDGVTSLSSRLFAVVVIGLGAIVLVAELTQRLGLREFLQAVALGSVLPIAAASWQGLATLLDTTPSLPLLDALPVPEGLEKTRDAVSTFGGPNGVRVKGTFGDPNHCGAYLVSIVAIAAGLTLDAVRREQMPAAVTHGALGVAATGALTATYSRAGWGGAAVGVVFLAALLVPLWRMERRKRVSRPAGWRRFAPVAAVVLALLALAPATPAVIDRIDPRSTVNSESNENHETTLSTALDQFRDSPVLGGGIGSLGVALNQGPRTSGAHSSYLTVAAELGLVGLVAMLLAAGIAVAGVGRLYWRSRYGPSVCLPAALLAGYVGFLLSNAVYDLWWDDFHWVLLGGLAAIAGNELAPRLSELRWPSPVPARRAPGRAA